MDNTVRNKIKFKRMTYPSIIIIKKNLTYFLEIDKKKNHTYGKFPYVVWWLIADDMKLKPRCLLPLT